MSNQSLPEQVNNLCGDASKARTAPEWSDVLRPLATPAPLIRAVLAVAEVQDRRRS